MDGLRDDLWTQILSYMDVPTLCTVRLVSKKLRRVASQLIRMLRVDYEMLQAHPAANFQPFTAAEVHVSYVAMSALHQISAHTMAGAVAGIAILHRETQVMPHHSSQQAALSGLPKLSSVLAPPINQQVVDLTGPRGDSVVAPHFSSSLTKLSSLSFAANSLI